MNTDEKLKQALVTIGFCEEVATQQVNDLNEVILQAVAIRLAKESGKPQLTLEELQQLISSKQTDGSLKSITEEESSRVVGEYIDHITRNFSTEKKQQFLNAAL